jgi:hypothetical protein
MKQFTEVLLELKPFSKSNAGICCQNGPHVGPCEMKLTLMKATEL